MTAREELAAVLSAQSVRVQVPNVGVTTGFLRIESAFHLADALLASPALAGVIREREFEAIKAANLRAIKHEIDTPSRGHGGCCGDQTEEPT